MDIYQVLHLLLMFCHCLLGAHSKHKSVHVLIIQSHFYLLQTSRQMLWIRKRGTVILLIYSRKSVL